MQSLLFPESFRHVCFSQNASDICQKLYQDFHNSTTPPLKNQVAHGATEPWKKTECSPSIPQRGDLALQSDDYEVFFSWLHEKNVSISKAVDVDVCKYIVYDIL